jgi:hypothetical protein
MLSRRLASDPSSLQQGRAGLSRQSSRKQHGLWPGWVSVSHPPSADLVAVATRPWWLQKRGGVRKKVVV